VPGTRIPSLPGPRPVGTLEGVRRATRVLTGGCSGLGVDNENGSRSQARIQLATENDSTKSLGIVMNRRYQVSTSQTFGYAGYFFFYWRFN
jgi:hypothetical protein